MAFFAWVFFEHVFQAYLLPEQADEYLAGAILLGAAPCTAMVLVWGFLAKGNDGHTLVMVAINSLTMLVLYGVLGGFLLGVGKLPVPWQALLLSIGRQESEFNTQIVWRAGARGVLQVMPITARHICRQYGIRCNISDLLSDPSYNARIASAYIADRRDQFGGSYILTLTGFNAGPGRTRQWLREMGDPRASDVAPLDWIYRIPFLETRLYVRKVLSNVQIYRARLGEKNPLRLDQDLRRGKN